MRHCLFIFIICLFTYGCGPTTKLPEIDMAMAKKEAEIQREMAISERLESRRRVQNIWWDIALNGVDLCVEDKKAYGTGIEYITLQAIKDGYGKEYKEAGKKVLSFHSDDDVIVSVLAKNTPAYRAGLRVKDEIIFIDGIEANGKKVKKIENHIQKKLKDGDEMTLHINRHGATMDIIVQPLMICDFPVFIDYQDRSINAFADGNRIIISDGMVNFADDDELALVVGHEMAHNTEKHIEQKRSGAGIGLAGDILLTVLTNGVYSGNLLTQTGANMYSQELEAEADYVGLYYAKLAGYDISKSPYFWRKMASKNPGGIHLDGSTHPSTAKRFLALEQAIDEIDKKEKEGKPLLPDRQE